MLEQIRQLLDDWIDPKKRNEDLLKQVYSAVFKKPIDKCPRCKAKAINELEKYYGLQIIKAQAGEGNANRRYVLKPGNHQFVSGSAHSYNNENTTDAELAMYLKYYPYIRPLFEKIPE